jgi:tRNA G37 N-methylase Trm5
VRENHKLDHKRYAQANIELNKCKDKVEAVLMDARDACESVSLAYFIQDANSLTIVADTQRDMRQSVHPHAKRSINLMYFFFSLLFFFDALQG